MRGSFGTENFDYIKIGILGCDLGEACAPEEDLYDISFNFVDLKAIPDLLSDGTAAYFQFILNSGVYHFLNPDMEISENILFTQSTVAVEDNIYDLLEALSEEYTFYEVTKSERVQKRQRMSKPLSEREFVRIYLRADIKSLFYKREKYDLLDYLGDLGGLKEIVFFIGYLITNHVVERMLMAHLVAKTYKIQNYGTEKSQYYATRFKNGDLTPDDSSDEACSVTITGKRKSFGMPLGKT